VAQPADTIGAIATKIFLNSVPARPWASERPLLQIMATENLTAGRLNSFEQITPMTNTVGVAEAWKWPVSTAAPGNGGAYDRGGTFTFAVSDTMISAQQSPYFYQQPIEVATSDLNVHAQAVGNERGIAYLVERMNDAKHKLSQILATDIVATTQGVAPNKINPLFIDIDSTGSSCGISQGDYANWASAETNLATERLTIRALAKAIRDQRRNKMASCDIIVCGSAVHQYLVDEAESRNLPYFDLVETFGKDADGQYKLHLEVSHSTIKVEGAPVVVDNYLDLVGTTNPGDTAFVISLKDYMLFGAQKDNFAIHGWEDVRLTAAKDATRAQITWAGFLAMRNRATHIKFINCKVS